MMVHRPWTQKDMLDALAHLPDPTVSGTRFSDELLLIFCKEFSPTTHELRRLLKKKLGLACQGEARQWLSRRKSTLPKYRTASSGVMRWWPTTTTRLHLLFNDHSGGMTEPTERGDTPTLWESHMIKWFLDGLLPHISAAIKKSCVGYEDARLTDLI
ncbi:hypothetical protein L3Q82_009571 [Scortum barcoo]|uniref:Uncharacterized protein n=1 Tax=Scortum barcoo TaxID=214431 RepID=A0ACB8WGF8_9TELE|nr:hypothetical protein L3Q82_009571 [Scortum barcoo]